MWFLGKLQVAHHDFLTIRNLSAYPHEWRRKSRAEMKIRVVCQNLACAKLCRKQRNWKTTNAAPLRRANSKIPKSSPKTSQGGHPAPVRRMMHDCRQLSEKLSMAAQAAALAVLSAGKQKAQTPALPAAKQAKRSKRCNVHL